MRNHRISRKQRQARELAITISICALALMIVAIPAWWILLQMSDAPPEAFNVMAALASMAAGGSLFCGIGALYVWSEAA